jgi:hypothetical protein
MKSMENEIKVKRRMNYAFYWFKLTTKKSAASAMAFLVTSRFNGTRVKAIETIHEDQIHF